MREPTRITLTLSPPTNTPLTVPIYKQYGEWAVHRAFDRRDEHGEAVLMPNIWQVTHVPSGQCVYLGHKLRRDAVSLAQTLVASDLPPLGAQPDRENLIACFAIVLAWQREHLLCK